MSATFSRYRRSPSVLSRIIRDEAILLAPESEHKEFHSLSGAAFVAWEVLRAPRTYPELVHMLGHIYGLASANIADDVNDALDRLLEKGLVEEVIDNDV